LRRAVNFAERETNRLRFRGTKGGVMPDGFDVTSLAAEAVMELFKGNCRLVWPYEPSELEKELGRLVHQQVDRLHRRKENMLMRNADDLAPLAVNEDGEHLSLI